MTNKLWAASLVASMPLVQSGSEWKYGSCSCKFF
jgi:hypothetical protein